MYFSNLQIHVIINCRNTIARSLESADTTFILWHFRAFAQLSQKSSPVPMLFWKYANITGTDWNALDFLYQPEENLWVDKSSKKKKQDHLSSDKLDIMRYDRLPWKNNFSVLHYLIFWVNCLPKSQQNLCLIDKNKYLSHWYVSGLEDMASQVLWPGTWDEKRHRQSQRHGLQSECGKHYHQQ